MDNIPVQPGVLGAQPPAHYATARGIVHKDTPAMPLVSNYPWLYKDTDNNAAIQTQLYRGTGNAKSRVLNNSIFYKNSQQTDDDYFGAGSNDGYVDGAAIHQATQCRIPTNDCTVASTDPDPSTNPYWVRMQLDSCTNQYILPMGLNPRYVMSPVFRADAYSWNENYCQHLFLAPVPCQYDLSNYHDTNHCLTDNGEAADATTDSEDGFISSSINGKHNRYDYRAWGYLERAWKDVVYTAYSPASVTPNQLTVGAAGHITVPAAVPADTDYTKYGDPLNYNAPGNADTNSYTGALTTINQLASRPYERIYDSTHPFSPRWDMTGEDDQTKYSSSTWFNPATNSGYSVMYSPCQVRCASVPVDILTFRAAEFNACIQCRIDVNTKCLWDEIIINNLILNADKYSSNPVNAVLDALKGTSPYIGKEFDILAFKIFGVSIWVDIGIGDDDHAFDFRCKSELQQLNAPAYNPWSQSGQWPPCSTTYDFPFDNHPGPLPNTSSLYAGPGTCIGCLPPANDYADNTGSSTSTNTTSTKTYRLSSVTKCCNDLAQPLAPVNMLKIRNLQDDPALKDGSGKVAEGYSFRDYFPSGHLPYMRWWDTGTGISGTLVGTPGGASGYAGMPAGGSGAAFPTFPLNDPLLGMNYDPHCNKGVDDVIVGVGEEADNGLTSPPGICRYGGGGDSNTFSCIHINNPDRLTSWYELKQTQVNAMRDYGLHCLPMHEKLRKWQEGEDGALYQAGKHFDAAVPEINDDPANQTLYEKPPRPWPLRWRGYLTDSRPTVTGLTGSYPYQFPNYESDPVTPAGAITTNLDNARVGDIIYVLPQDAAATTGHIMPFIAVVTGVSPHHGSGTATADLTKCHDPLDCTDPDTTCSDFIQISDINNGKFPDACGDTDYRGMGQTRTIYKEWIEPDKQDVLFGGGGAVYSDSCGDIHSIYSGTTMLKSSAGGNCMDPKYTVCTFSDGLGGGPGYWNDIHVYRPSLDERTSTGTSTLPR